MFYDLDAITYLINRIGWAKGITPETSPLVPLSEGNSGKYFKDYNQLVTVENMLALMPYADVSSPGFKDYIQDLKEENVRMVLGMIFDNEERAYYRYCYGGNRQDISGIDYSGRIQSSQGLFDNVLGLRMAITCVELFISSVRENIDTRNVKFSWPQLVSELNGIKTDDGRTVSMGLYAKLKIEKEKVLNILFPSNKQNYVIGRKVW